MNPLNLQTVFGYLLIAAGLIPGPIPILPGVPLIAAGAELLGPHHPIIRPCRPWLQARGMLNETAKDDFSRDSVLGSSGDRQ